MLTSGEKVMVRETKEIGRVVRYNTKSGKYTVKINGKLKLFNKVELRNPILVEKKSVFQKINEFLKKIFTCS